MRELERAKAKQETEHPPHPNLRAQDSVSPRLGVPKRLELIQLEGQLPGRTPKPLTSSNANVRRKHQKKSHTTPLYKRWWFWTAIGAAVAGGTLGAYFMIRNNGPSVPDNAFAVWDLP